MSQQFDPYEPLPDHLADTGPIRRVSEVSGWRRAVGFISLIGAVGLTIATVLLLLNANSPTPAPNPAPATIAPTTAANVAGATPVPQTNPGVQTLDGQATLSPDTIARMLSTPVASLGQLNGLEVVRDDYNPFTVIPDRPRSEVIQYQVKDGDTIFAIADRFGLKPETIAWSNDRTIVEALRPGKTLNILPINGVYYTVTSDQSIDSIAKQYHVDPYTIIDSQYNDLFGDGPDTKLPSNTKVVVPGGVDEQINWNPRVDRIPASRNSSGSSAGDKIAFDVGDPGSCGLVDNPGGSGGWRLPLAGYSWVRGFSSIHTGVDLADPIGTSIMAATAGRVVFAGWSNWGYGWSVVIASGPFTEIYGHMSAYYANCGQMVSPGQVIGAVGQSGNATGPHLHFEVRYNDIPTDPTGIMAF